MDKLKKSRFRTVEVDEMDYKQKIRAHRILIAKTIFFVVLIVAIILVALYLYFRYKEYNDYVVVDKENVETISEAEYYTFAGGVLKVSRDGAIYLNANGKQIWNQTYEMNQPTVDICGNYVAIASVKDTRIYILDKSELRGEVQTEDPIRAVEVSDSGTIAVLTEGDTSYKVMLYDKRSNLLAQGEFHLENTGYPMAIALSADGIKLGVSLINIEDGHSSTRIQFYNFGSVGQNEIDNLVCKYEYEGIIVPQIEYLNKDTMIAYGTNQIMLYTGDQKPEEAQVIPVKQEMKTIFYSDNYIGYSYDDEVTKEEDTSTQHYIALYDLNGKEVLRESFSMKYEKVTLLNDEEVCITRDNHCLIFTLDGVKKYQGDMDNDILNVTKGTGPWDYTFLLNGQSIDIRLR